MDCADEKRKMCESAVLVFQYLSPTCGVPDDQQEQANRDNHNDDADYFKWKQYLVPNGMIV